MKIYVAKYEPGRTGGGWTFADHFVKGMGEVITQDYAEADVYFITSPSMVQREDVHTAVTAGKKIVVRLDNAVRNSRNRNTGMSRMKDFCDLADLVIYQSQWAKDYLMPFTKRDGPVILNGTDLEWWNDDHSGSKAQNNILYSRFNRDETKNWEAARYWYSQYQLEHPEAILHIVGQFSQELRDGNFDFYNGENFHYYGVLDARSMSRLYSISCLLYTYFNDACSNTLVEALVSGCPIVGDGYYLTTGGSLEIYNQHALEGRDYFSTHRMINDYKDAMQVVL